MLKPEVLQFRVKEELILSTGEDSDVKYLRKCMEERCPNLIQDKRKLIIEFTGPEKLQNYKRIVKELKCMEMEEEDEDEVLAMDNYHLITRNKFKRIVKDLLIRI